MESLALLKIDEGMSKDKIVQSAFTAIDNSDATVPAGLMNDNAVFRFRNNPEVVGKQNIVPFLKGFFKSIRSTRYDQIEACEVPGANVMNGRVASICLDGSTYSCWFSNTFRMKDRKIKEYLIFVNNSKLCAN